MRTATMEEPSLVIPGAMAATVHVPSGNEEPAVNKVNLVTFYFCKQV